MEAVSRTSGVRQSRWRSCCILIHLQTYVCVDGTRHIRTLLSEFLKNTSQKDSAPDASSLRNTWFRPCSTHKYLAFHIVQDLQHWLSLPILAENKVVHGTLRPICLCVLVLEERERGKNPWWFSYILQLRQKKKKITSFGCNAYEVNSLMSSWEPYAVSPKDDWSSHSTNVYCIEHLLSPKHCGQ